MASAAARIEMSPQASTGLFSSPAKRRSILSLLLALLTLVAYNPIAHNDFVSFDDPAYITGNKHVRAGLTWQTVKWTFRSTEHANWLPLTWLSHALDYQLFHLRPAGHHYVNLLLHAASVILLFLFLEKTTGLAWRSSVVAALFAIHPMNVESVAWASERKSVLCTLFFVVGLGAYAWYARNPNLKRYIAVWLAFALGLMSKPMGITFPFVLLLMDYWPLGRMNFSARANRGGTGEVGESSDPGRRSLTLTQLVLEKIPLFALSVASAVITVIAQRGGGAIHNEHPLLSRLLNAIVSYSLYIQKAIWPAHLTVLYPYPEHVRPAWQVAAAIVVLVSFTAGALLLRQKRYLAMGWFWYLGTLIPMIGLVQVGEQAMADRYAYIPLIGLFIAAIWGIADWVGSKRLAVGYLAAATAIVLASFGTLTFFQIGYWHDSKTLWSHALAVTERNFVAHDSLGADFIDEGRIQEAKAQFQAAAAINPKDAFSQLDLGVCEKRLGNIQSAMQHYQAALDLSSDPSLRSTAFGNMGSIYRMSGDYTRARQSYEAALQLIPDSQVALIGQALIEQKTGNLSQAISYYRRAVNTAPSDAGYLLLAQALEKSGLTEEAKVASGQAQRLSADLNPTWARVNHLLAE